MQEPALLQAGFLVDIVTARQLFAYHLPEMCTKRSKSNALFNTIADSARLHNSILSVLGYFPTQEVHHLTLSQATTQSRAPQSPAHRVIAIHRLNSGPIPSVASRSVILLTLSCTLFQVQETPRISATLQVQHVDWFAFGAGGCSMQRAPYRGVSCGRLLLVSVLLVSSEIPSSATMNLGEVAMICEQQNAKHP